MTDIAHTADVLRFRKPALTGAQRAAAYRARKKQKVQLGPNDEIKPAILVTPAPVTKPAKPVTRVTPVTPSRSIAQLLLVGTAFALAGVGVTMNGWYAHTLGSSEIAGWVFTAIGVAADAMALALPACAALKWQAHQRGVALAAWLVWALVFAFTLTAGIGFASVNIADVTASRASRVTPAVTAAQAALDDAKAARDRECRSGTGKFCRDREAQVTERQGALNVAMAAVEQKADPQTEAARRMVAWVSLGLLRPTGDDFAMLRLVLLSLLPQLGGILLMVSRR